MKKYFKLNKIFIVLFLTSSFSAAFAANFTVTWTSITLSNSCAGTASAYTLAATNTNNANAVMNLGVTVTINFPAGTDATNCTTGTYFGTAIGVITHVSNTQITFASPIAVPVNTAFTVVLNNVTNMAAGTSNLLVMTAPNNSAGTNTFNNRNYTINPLTITTGSVSGSPFCAGASVSVPFTVGICPFTGGNTFTAQLSNAAGSFAAPTTIGTLADITSGTIAAIIPFGTLTGAGYRIRVIGSTPVITGTDNGTNLTINLQTITTGPVATPLCKGATVNIPFTVGICPFTGGNTFTAQLSDATGSFAAPTTIGTLADITSGTIAATIPAGTATGTGYLIRVIGSTPAITGTSNSNGNITISTPMTYASSSVAQFSTNISTNCTLTNAILEIQVVVTGSCTPLSITQFNFNTTGSTNPLTDIIHAKVYYTSQTQGFTTSTQFGANVSNPSGAFTINGSQELSFGAGTYYFYLAYDVPSTAAVSDVVDASMTSFVIGGSTTSDMTTPNPTGSRTIVAGSSCSYTITQFPDLNFCGSVYTTAADQTVSFTLNESSAGNEFDASQTNRTIILTLPAGFAFDLAAGPTVTRTAGRDITAIGMTWTASTITVTLTTDATPTLVDNIDFHNFNIYPTGPGSGDLLRTGGTFTVEGSTGNPISSQSFGHMLAGPPTAYSSSAVNQYTTASINKNCTNSTNAILEIQVNVSNPCSPVTITQFNFNTTGSTNPATDITEAEIYYTGQTQGLSYDNWVGLTSAPNGAFTITTSQALELGAGTYYFYLVYDVPASATTGDVLDASMTSFVINGVTETDMSTPNPAGSRTVATGICPPTPDVLNPPANNQTVTLGSLVIPMDNAHQNLFGGLPFNLRAYGLVNDLLMNDIPVKWVIKSGKAKDAPDFTANASRVYPTVVAVAPQTFVASEFIVDSFYVDHSRYPGGKTATQVITAFEAFPPAPMVAVYKLTADVVVDVRYTLTARPKIAVFSNGTFQPIQKAMLDTARVRNYTVEDAGDFGGLAACYTFCSEAHWLFTPGDPVLGNLAPVQNIVDFVNEGGNFLAQCQGIDLYENHQPQGGHFQTTNGIVYPGNGTITNTSYNPDMAYNQYQGAVASENGLIASFWPAASSVYKPEMYYGVSTPAATTTVVATGTHVADPDSVGSNVYYLGGHSYPSNSLGDINGSRMYLNAALVPARRPTAFVANAGSNTTICSGQSIALGGSPTGPAGAFYTWSPSTGLNNPNLSNPVATPTITTTYNVFVNNDGCPGSGQVTITVVPKPISNANIDQAVCANNANVTLNGSVTNATGGTWTTSGTGTFSPNANTLNATYIPSNADATAGTITLTLSSTGNNASCNPATDNMIVTITPAPKVNANIDQTVCANNTNVTLNGSVTIAIGGTWSSSGTGTFSPNANTLNATYTLSNADVAADSVKLRLTSTGNGTCNTVVDTMTIRVTLAPIASVGATKSMTVCANAPVTIAGTVTNATGIWSTTGSGVFSPDVSVNATSYTLSNADIAAGTVKLVLSATGLGVCNTSTARDTLTITITRKPTASVGVTKSMTVCANAPVAIAGTVTNGTGVWSTTGSGAFSPDASVNATSYTLSNADIAAGTVKLVLSATGLGVCNTSTARDTLTITITPKPIASVGVSKSMFVCSNVLVPIAGTVTNATGGIWSSSGGGTFNPDASVNATSYTLSNADIAAGKVKLILSATGIGGCSISTARDTLTITIIPQPTASVGVSKSMTVCSKASVIPIASTVANATGIWSSTGSGVFSPDVSVNATSYTLSNADIAAEKVKLILSATALGVCSPSTVTDTLTITITPQPIASVGVIKSMTVCVNAAIVPIAGTVTNAIGVWSSTGTGFFTPNKSINAISYTFSKADTLAGIVKLVLSATGFGACSTYTDTDTLTIRTSPAPYVSVGASHSIAICTNNANVALKGTVGGATGGIWTSSGTGTFSPSNTALTTVYIPSSLDTAQSSIKLFLRSTGNGACNSVMDSMMVTMLDPPSVNFNNTSVCKNYTTSFSDNSTAITSIKSRTWNFGDSNTGIGQSPTHLYAIDGSYPVTLTIADANNCVSSFTKSVIVHPLPFAAFNSTAQCFIDSVFFKDLSTISSGSVVAWKWSFGDGGVTSVVKNPSHLYPGPASYNGRLIVTSNFGCLDTVSQLLDVKPSPKANFINKSVCLNNVSLFSDSSTISAGNITTWNWNFNDGKTSTLINPNHTFLSAGTHDVQLITISAAGCSDTIIKKVIVFPLPESKFTSVGQCLIDGTNFTDISTVVTGSIISWQWYFGDGGNAAIQNPAHTYTIVGNYPASLIVKTDKGCLDTLTQLVQLDPSPIAGFTPDKQIVVLFKPVSLVDQSKGATSWLWDFGDSNGSSTQPSPTYTYLKGGTYTVRQVVKNSLGCTDTFFYKIIVTQPPAIPNGFSPNGDGQNDVLFVKGGPYKNLDFRIYNNWGELIFMTKNETVGWDGTRNGIIQPMDVYVYTMTGTTEDNVKYELHGDVTLLR